MTPAEQFAAAYTAYVAYVADLETQKAALQAQNDLLTARNAALVTLVDQMHLLAHQPLA